MKSKNIPWVNNGRALCMISVYLIHSQIYYGTGNVGEVIGYMLLPFYVNLFFFISGFLFLRKVFRSGVEVRGNTGLLKNTSSDVLFRLVIPTLLFSTLIYIPKLLFHGRDISLIRYFYDVFGGVSFWFTSALTLVQLLFAFIVYSGGRKPWMYVGVSILFFIAGNVLYNINPSPFPWHYKSALCASLFFSLGGLYAEYESKLVIAKKNKYIVVSMFVLLMLGTYGYRSRIACGMMGVGYNLLGTMISLFSIYAVLCFSELIGSIRVLDFIGRKSIVFYFFSGVMPAFWGTVAMKLFLEVNEFITLAVTTAALVSSAFIVWFIERFTPYLLDFRIIRRKN